MRADFVHYDEESEDRDRREVIVVREDGTTYALSFPAEYDLGEVLNRGESVGFDISVMSQ